MKVCMMKIVCDMLLFVEYDRCGWVNVVYWCNVVVVMCLCLMYATESL